MGLKISANKNKHQTATEKKKTILDQDIHLFGSKFSNSIKEDFYSELSILLQSGINLQRSLQLISEIQKKDKISKIIQEIEHSIVNGVPFSEALKKRKEFSSYEHKAILIGEQTGELPRIIEDLRKYFNRKNELKRQITSSLAYPITVLILAVVVVWFMLRYVVPMFVDIFQQNKVDLPWLTSQIVNISDFFNAHSWSILIVLILIILLYRYISKKDLYHRVIGSLQLKIPVFGDYIRKIYLIQFTQAMTLLTFSKVPIVDALILARKMIRFHPLEQSLIAIEKDIISGIRMDHSFAKHTLYDRKMIALLQVAEETNQTEFIFQKLYDQYSTELKYKGQLMTTTLNFLLTLVVGLIVAVILIAMYLPMFRLSSIIG
jgi:type IV pilus assembly protein PilC|tara:strand:+ start:31248 stop:32375 length:1128 start_codon:yes stop_codon:yes gene_type:complete